MQLGKGTNMTNYQEYTVRVHKDYTEYLNKDGELHRLEGPAIEWSNGTKGWYVNGKRHRTDGPAFDWGSGSKGWYVDNKPHRLDGPAFEWSSGYKEWYVEGKCLTEQQFKALTSKPKCSGKIVEIDGIKYQLKEVK